MWRRGKCWVPSFGILCFFSHWLYTFAVRPWRPIDIPFLACLLAHTSHLCANSVPGTLSLNQHAYRVADGTIFIYEDMMNLRKPCRFGAKCRNAATCRFDHPAASMATPNNIKKSRGPCKFGEQCTRSGCWFDHPPRLQKKTVSSVTTTTTTVTSFEIGAPISSSTSATAASSSLSKDDNKSMVLPYQFCSKKEYEERQELGQVSILEATAETCMLPQHQRKLDPSLAIAKYRRSAAGTVHQAQSRETLESLLKHLSVIAATRRPVPHHPGITITDDWVGPWSEFLVDRLRACQADATRLFGQKQHNSSLLQRILPSTWHVQMARIVIWVRYWMPPSWRQPDKFMIQTLNTMLSTAMDHYWSTIAVERSSSSFSSETTKVDTKLDDEMLCYAALSRLSQSMESSSGATSSSDSTSTLGTILLDYTKHVPPLSSSTSRREDYPLYQEALQLTASTLREEYFAVLRRSKQQALPILARCCLAPGLALWRYRQCQQYNVSFGKGEAVEDLDSLLEIGRDEWSPKYVQDLLGLPCQTSLEVEESFAVIFKQVGMPEDAPFLATNKEQPQGTGITKKHPRSQRDVYWVFGSLLDTTQTMGMSDERVQDLFSLEGRLATSELILYE